MNLPFKLVNLENFNTYKIFNPSIQSWLRDGIFSGSLIPIGIFYFGLDRKIPKSRGTGSGFENPEKIPSEKSRDRDLFIRDIPGISRSGGGIFLNFGIFILGIFAKSPGFFPRDSGFFTFVIGIFFLTP